MLCKIIVFPALGGEIIIDLCPFPIGLTKSINLGVKSCFLSGFVNSTSMTNCLSGYNGVKLSKAILCLDLSGSSKLSSGSDDYFQVEEDFVQSCCQCCWRTAEKAIGLGGWAEVFNWASRGGRDKGYQHLVCWRVWPKIESSKTPPEGGGTSISVDQFDRSK